MISKAADPRTRDARRSRNRTSGAFALTGTGRLRIAVTIAAALVPASSLLAQLPQEQDAAGPMRFTAKVRNLGEGATRIRVPLNHSVLIETSKPSKRVQAIDPSIVFAQSVSPTQILVTGAGTGTTQVLAWSENGEQQIFEITVELDLTALNEALQTVDPLADVEAVPLLGNIVLTGTASSADMAQRLLEVGELFIPDTGVGAAAIVQNHMMVAGEQQVLLRVTIAEVSRSATRQLGINGFLAGENFRDAFVVNQLGGVNPINFGAQPSLDVTQNMLFGSAGVPLSPSVPLSLGFPRAQMQVFIQAMADNSLLRILAEPNLVAISGETASFLVGGEFPYPVPQGVDQITIEFREFGARLNFTPVVRPGERIRMNVAPEFSKLDFSNAVQVSGFTVPGINQRRLQSTVEVANGQTLAIAGLLNDEVRGVASRIPGIGDVPILGSLFRSVEYQRDITELVILVTPEIVAPLNPHQVPQVPGEHYVPPNDFELYAMGLLEGEAPEHTVTDGATRRSGGDNPPTKVQSQPDQMSVHGPWGPATESD